MSAPRDEATSNHPAAIAADLLAWIRQNEQMAPPWYIEDGAAAPELAGVGMTSATESAAAPPGPDDAAAPADPAFAASCAAFVAETLALMAREGVPAGGSLPPDPLLAAHGGDKAAALAELSAEVLPCAKCELHATRTHTVFGVGNPDADLVFIGEAPGQDEDLQGEPFVGRSGQLLTKILRAIGYARQDVYICNILKCRPPNNRDPLPDEVHQCEPHLRRQLAILRPRAICCLGRIAAQTLLGTDASLGRLRQTVHFYTGVPVMVTFHPAALLRNPGWKRDTWDDVRRLRALVDALQ